MRSGDVRFCIHLPLEADAKIGPVPTAGGGQRPEPALDRLSNILKAFNDLLGDIAWQDRDRVGGLITGPLLSHYGHVKTGLEHPVLV